MCLYYVMLSGWVSSGLCGCGYILSYGLSEIGASDTHVLQAEAASFTPCEENAFCARGVFVFPRGIVSHEEHRPLFVAMVKHTSIDA